MKKILIVLAVVLAAGLAGFFAFRNSGEDQKYRFEKVSRGEIVATVTATGTVNPVTNVLVGTQVSGTIKEIYVDFNSPVRKGQIIAQIDPAIHEASVEKERANLLSSRANLEKAESALLDARRIYERNRELAVLELVTRAAFETAETNYQSAMAQVSAASAQVAQAAAALKTAETNLRYTRILSPVDGIVVSRNVDVGQTVAASFQTPTLFLIAQDLTKMQLLSNVAEADIGKIRKNQTAEFTVDAYPDTEFAGLVSEVRNAPTTVQNVVTYDVVIKVDNPDFKLKPGMTANVTFIVEKKQDVLRIPNSALRFRPPDAAGKEQKPKVKGRGVWVLANKKPERVAIETGLTDGSFAELISGDIREGQELIVELQKKDKKPSSSGPRMF